MCIPLKISILHPSDLLQLNEKKSWQSAEKDSLCGMALYIHIYHNCGSPMKEDRNLADLPVCVLVVDDEESLTPIAVVRWFLGRKEASC